MVDPSMRWALVTGATGSVGRACAEALAAAGVGVIVTGREAGAAARVADAIQASGGIAVARALDVSDAQGVEEQLDLLATSGIVPSVVVNAAGEFGPLGPALSASPADWTRILDVNLLALIRLAGLVIPTMVAAGGGRLIHVSTAAALATPESGNAPYSVSKAAANRFLAHLAADLRGTSVTVHAFHPGEIRSRMWQHIRDSSVGVAGLESYAAWALATESGADTLDRVGMCVTALLDDGVARRAHGQFLWAQRGDEMEPLS